MAGPSNPSNLHYYCNVTFQRVGDVGPDGTSIVDKLIPCPRCRETFYCGEKQRLEHWKIHGNVCLPAKADVDGGSFRDLSVSETILEFAGFFNPHWDGSPNSNLLVVEKDLIVGRSFRFLLQHLQTLCHKQDFEPTKEETEAVTILYRVLMNLVIADNETIELLWAIPGMTTYLMNLDLISEVMRQRKIQGARPTAKEYEFQGFDPTFQIPKFFSNIVGFILMGSAFKDPNREASPSYRQTLLARAASRKCMEWYACPYTRVSIPSYATFYVEDDVLGKKGPRDIHFLWILTALLRDLPNDPWDKSSIVPGLSLQDAFTLFTEEPVLAQHAPASVLFNLVQALLHSQRVSRVAWESFSVPARAQAAHQIVEHYFSRDTINQCTDDNDAADDNACGSPNKPLTARVECGRDLIGSLTGWNACSDIKDESMWLRVIKEASGNDTMKSRSRHTEYFQQWYDCVSREVDATLEEFLVKVLTLPNGGFAPELIPPTDALQNIIEFAMQPF